jgi:Calx-beta domain/Domain of unknown function (DUF4214)
MRIKSTNQIFRAGYSAIAKISLSSAVGVASLVLALVFLQPATARADGGTPPAATTVQFSRSSFEVAEGVGSITVTVTRTGVLTGTVTVDYNVGADDDGADTASQQKDFTFASGTLTFAPGDTSKSFQVLITENSFVQPEREAKILLSNVTGGAALGNPSRASLEIDDDDVAGEMENPIDDHHHFVRQHYHDFLNREPDQGGLDYWVGQLEDCGTDAPCLDSRRRDVSAAFYMSQEFQNTGFLVFKLEKASFARRPDYQNFMRNVQEISRNAIARGVDPSRQMFVADWANRAEFHAEYDRLSNDDYVDELYRNAGVQSDPVTRNRQVDDLNNNRRRRGDVLNDVIQNHQFDDNQFNPAFVLMQYFGYLRRNPDEAGYQFWVGKLEETKNQPNNYQSMVNGFVKATEYRHRFGDN